LTCLVPAAGSEGGIEEIATDLLAQRLCAALSIEFHATYLPRELPPPLLERRAAEARHAVAAALDDPLDVKGVLAARAALGRLSGFELAALALLEAGLPAPRLRWPAPFAAEVAEPRALLSRLLPELAGPQLLRGLCRLFARRRWNDRRRGPLW